MHVTKKLIGKQTKANEIKIVNEIKSRAKEQISREESSKKKNQMRKLK